MTIVKEIADHFRNYPTFTYRDVKLYLIGRKLSARSLPRLISYMKNKGVIYIIRKGSYTFNRDIMMAGFAYSPFYYGLLSALTIRDLWTQNSKPEIITLRKVRSSSQHIFEDKKDVIFIHHIPVKYFFGFEMADYGKFRVPVSDPEKTLIDLFYYKVKLPIQDYSKLLKTIKTSRLKMYLKVYDPRLSKIVLGFVKKHKKEADSGILDNPY